MKLKKMILMSTSVVGMGLLIPTAIRVNQYNHYDHPKQSNKLNKSILSEGLKITKPTTSNAPVKFTGSNKHGIFNAEYKNTTVQYYDLLNNPVKTPPTNIMNGESLYIGYTPNKGYTWDDGTNQIIDLLYTVKGLHPYPVPSLNDNQYHYVKASEPHDNYNYYLGIGYNNTKKLVGNSYPYDYKNYQSWHNAGTAPGIVAKGYHYQYTPITIWYFDTLYSNNFGMPNGCPRFTTAFDGDLNSTESTEFSSDYVQNKIAYSSVWTDAYRDHLGILIHFHTWYGDAIHRQFYATVTIQTASQTLWTKTFDC